MKWILILVIWSELGHIRSDQISFPTQKACEAAKEAIISKMNSNPNSPTADGFCFPRYITHP